MALTAGSIAFVGYNADGTDGIAFIVIDTIDPGQVIRFNDNEWNGTAFNTGEGSFTWTNGGTALQAGTIVELLNISSAATRTANIGTISGSGVVALGNSDEALYAFVGTSETVPTTFIAAVTNNNGGFDNTDSGTLTGTGLVAGSTALVLPGTGGADVAAFDPTLGGTVFATRTAALTAFNTAANFVTQDAANNQDADNVTPDAPFLTDAQSPIAGVTFTIGGETQTVVFSSPLSVSQNEGNAGTTNFTFTVSRTGGTTGAVSFSGQLSSAAANAADFNGAASVPFNFNGTILAGQATATVTILVNGDATVEPDESFTLTLTTVNNPAAGVTTALGAQTTATGTIQNDDVVVDNTPPTLASSSPSDNAVNVAIGANVTLTFSEAVKAGTGNITISNGAGDTRTISVTDASQVTFNGSTVTINPTADLNPGTAYDVTFGSGVITDLANNAFGGIAQNALDFTTSGFPITILQEAPSLAGATVTPTATNAVQLVRLGNFVPTSGTNAEVVTFDPTTDKAFVLNTIGEKIDVVGISASGAVSSAGSIDLTALADYGPLSTPNSVAVKNGILAVAFSGGELGANGFVALFNASNNAFIKTVAVGSGPDQIVFTADGSKLLVANEGEPFSVTSGTPPVTTVVNPEGSISIINIGTGADAAVASTVEFDALNGFEAQLEQAGVGIFTGQSAASDIEPEYITISPDGTRAYVTLQEVNAVAVIDLTAANPTQPIAILPLGGVDHNLAGNAFDGSDRDGIANLRNADVIGLLQPDAIASFKVGADTYFITANEGDARVGFPGASDDEANLGDAVYVIDAASYGGAAAVTALKDNTTGLGRLRVRTDLGDTDGDGDIDQIYAYGGRSLSIFKQNADGTITKVRETGGEFEAIIARDFASRFNVDTAEGVDNSTPRNPVLVPDNRSDNKGPEPEGVDIGVVNGRTYAFVTLERVGGVMIYDVTDPANASYVGYRPPLAGEGNAPETTKFISAEDSPTGTALVLTANEGNSGANFAGAGLTVYAALEQGYTQQVRIASSSTSLSKVEGDSGPTAFTFTVERTNGTIGDVNVQLTLASGASNGASANDFSGVANLPNILTVTIPAGQTSATVTVNVQGDTAFEQNENFTLTVTGATTSQEGVTAAVAATQIVATGTIQNDDAMHIYDVQGAGHRSAFTGQTVTVRGIVTAIDAVGSEGGSNNPVGYYIQDAVGDGDFRTSDGIFVFLGTGTGVTIPANIVIGAEVQVTATVSEFARTNELSTTQLNPTAAATVLSTGNALPTAVRIGDVNDLVTGLERKPALVSLGDDDGDTTPPAGVYDPVNQGADFWESLEGMRVTLEDVRITSPFRSNFDEQFATPNVGVNPSDNGRGGLTISDTTPGTLQPADKVFDFNPERIQLDDDAGINLPTGLQTGDRLGDVTGVVNYAFGQYEVNLTQAVTVTQANLQKEVTTITENFDRIRVASFNVENLAPVGQLVDGVATPASKFAGIASAIVTNVKAPEIIALQEVLDNDGATSSSITSASQTLSALIDAIVAAGGPRYVAIDSPPIDNIGGIPGGNQRVAYLYNPLAVTPSARNGLTDIVTENGVAKVQLFPSANQIGQGNSDFNATRKSLPIEWSPVGYTDDQGGTFWTVNNHLSSKGGSAPLYGTNLELPLYADPLNGSAQAANATQNEREGQAETINAYVDGILANGRASDDKVVVLGDLNDFQFFPVVDLITGQVTRVVANVDGTPSVFEVGSPVLAELISKLPENERYSFNFDGNMQVLDHILVTNNLFDSANFDIVHINSEFIDQISDHDPSVSSLAFSRSAAIATNGADVFDQAAYTAKFGARGSLAGNDTISGLGGDDRIAAGAGNDQVDGGSDGPNGDTAVFSGNRSNYTVTQNGVTFTIVDNRAGTNDGTDTVTNVEKFEFADRTLTAAQLLDAAAPTLTASNPLDNATNVAAGSNIVLTFNEAVAAGTGNIVISNGAGDTRTISITDASQVTISGNTVTINPTADLQAGQSYDVTLSSGVITDTAGNAFTGIATDALDFTVAAPQNFRLQLLHFSDGEASLLATKTAKNLAALVDKFEDEFANSITISGGDNFLAGPFLSAGTDPSVRAAINAASGSTVAAGVNVPIAAADIAILNAIGVETSTLGNHEFDLGSRVLRDAFTPGSVAGYAGANFVYLSSNLDFSLDADLNPRFTNTVGNGATPTVLANTLKGRIAPAAVLVEGGERIGIIGATTQILESISSPTGTEVRGFPGGPGANGEVNDMDLLAAQLQPIIDEMIAEGINKIIVQSHLQQIQFEKLLATKLRGVDIILSAGSDTRLANDDDALASFPGHSPISEGPYPIVTTGADGGTTVIVNTDSEYTYLGRLVVDFDQQGRIVTSSLSNTINGAYSSTAETVAAAYNTTVDNLENTAFANGTRGDLVRDVTDAVQAVINVKDGNLFGFSNVYLEGERSIIRNEETNLGDITADANKAALRDVIGDVPYVISLKNGGGIRSSIGTVSDPDPVTGAIMKLPTEANPEANKPAGAISQLDIENALRFDNKLMAFDTTVQGLLNILNWGAGLGPNNGGFPQIGGVAYSYDPTRPGNVGTTPGSRIRDLALIDENGKTILKLVDNGVILNEVPSKITVIALNFTANGGDGYPAKANGENFRYLLANGTLSNAVDEALDFTAPAGFSSVGVTAADVLGEQKAFQDYLQERFSTPATAFNTADTTQAGDLRIQNQNARTDTVLDAQAVNFNGGAGDETINGAALDDTLSGNGGNDKVFGFGGNDQLRGGGGNDKLYGQTGRDTLLGGSGDDLLDGGEQDDQLEGGRGNDDLVGGVGSDTYSYEFGDGSDTVTEAANTPADSDTLVFQDLNATDVRFQKFGADTQIVLSDGSIITLKGQETGGGVEKVVFANGQQLDRNGIINAEVNRAPVAVDDTAANVAEDALSFIIPFASILGNDTDADLDTLSITAVSNPIGGTVQIVAGQGVRFTPAANFNGPASFEYTVSDGRNGSDIGKVSFTVTAVNDAPTTTPANVSTNEDTQFVGQVAATDVDGDALTYTVATGAQAAQHGTVTVNALGQYTYTPALNFNGTDSFVIKVSDGIAPPVDAVINVTVNPINDAPTVVSPATASTNEDTAVVGQITANDVDGDTLTYTVGTGAQAAQHGNVIVDANGQYTYTPALNFNGTDSFVIKVSDGFAPPVDVIVNVNIAPVNDAPVAVADTGTAGENEMKIFDLAANDTDVESGLGSPILTGFQVTGVSGISLTNEQAASAFSIQNGKLQFAPGEGAASPFNGLNDGQSATVTVSYTVKDALDANLTSTGTFTLTVNGETDANIVEGTNGTNLLFGTDGVDLINARGAPDFVFAQGGNDTIHAGEGNDFVFGGAGDDTINGNGGRDNLFGEDGNDVINGGAGNDLLYGGAGSDTFVFQFNDSGRDIVFDFTAGAGAGHDVVQLDKAVFADFTALMASSAFHDSAIGAQIEYQDGSSITLLGVSKASLTIDDFKFA